MMKQRGMLYLMTALFLMFIGFLCVSTEQNQMISFQVWSGDNCQTVTVWEQEDGYFYVFLPSYANLEDVKVVLHTGDPVRMNGMRLENGMDCGAFSDGVLYTLSYGSWRMPRQGKLLFLKSANIAAMYLETQSGGMNYIHREKGNKESGTVTLLLADGEMVYSGKIETIQGRGNSTWEFEKKPYSIKLTEEADLLNLGKAQKWVLLANAGDSSHIRNKVVYDFAHCVGLEYAPGSDWVDLYLNGEYAGLYLLTERNEVHPQRVNLEGIDVFLVSLEKHTRLTDQDYPHISTAEAQALRIHYPEKPTASQLKDLKGSWQSLEDALLLENGKDPVTGKTWMEQINLNSWVKKYLVEEIFGNYDACFISQFFYRDEKGKICAGPVWDYDNSMGSELGWQLKAPNTLYGNRYDVGPGFYTPWFHCLYEKELFFMRMVEIYQRDFLPLLNDFLNKHIEDCGKQIAQARKLDQVRWNLEETNLDAEVNYLQTFMQARIAFLNRIWIDCEPYYTVKADNASGNYYGYFVVFPGETLDTLPVLKSTDTRKFLGWYDTATGEPFSSDHPIREDMELHAKWKNESVVWLGRMGKVAPILVLGLMLVLLLYVDWNRTKVWFFRK